MRGHDGVVIGAELPGESVESEEMPEVVSLALMYPKNLPQRRGQALHHQDASFTSHCLIY